ncbi:MAG: hypothetical protein AAB373_03995 [Patescibacteria group bacterium]
MRTSAQETFDRYLPSVIKAEMPELPRVLAASTYKTNGYLSEQDLEQWFHAPVTREEAEFCRTSIQTKLAPILLCSALQGMRPKIQTHYFPDQQETYEKKQIARFYTFIKRHLAAIDAKSKTEINYAYLHDFTHLFIRALEGQDPMPVFRAGPSEPNEEYRENLEVLPPHMAAICGHESLVEETKVALFGVQIPDGSLFLMALDILNNPKKYEAEGWNREHFKDLKPQNFEDVLRLYLIIVSKYGKDSITIEKEWAKLSPDQQEFVKLRFRQNTDAILNTPPKLTVEIARKLYEEKQSGGPIRVLVETFQKGVAMIQP